MEMIYILILQEMGLGGERAPLHPHHPPKNNNNKKAREN